MAAVSPKTALAQRIRRARLSAGITIASASRATGVSVTSWSAWERGTKTPKFWRGEAIASALGVPIASLFIDDCVLGDVRVSPESLKAVRAGGREASREIAERLARALEPLLYGAATRRPVAIGSEARAKPRRTRAQVLAGIEQANAMRRAAIEPRLSAVAIAIAAEGWRER